MVTAGRILSILKLSRNNISKCVSSSCNKKTFPAKQLDTLGSYTKKKVLDMLHVQQQYTLQPTSIKLGKLKLNIFCPSTDSNPFGLPNSCKYFKERWALQHIMKVIKCKLCGIQIIRAV